MPDDIGRSRGTDYFGIGEELTAEERDYWNRARHFVDDEVLPVINEAWEQAEFPARWPSGWASSAWSATGSWATAARR
ncbi:hypothetical protein [Barrientosiimonas endolithica]|uniref:Acyl-CoA dehydrogenase/oxidase N-terminal domain-containing protein n=1 Tax=Barrientosiimonas endolithica TaxID=1535208 RepID=A0ABN6YM49_9MICO|nr:hypothetical protein [Barrientosiimonas endolithica]BDZ58435.1 hypothetical protein GCM10025872_20920 [Barrientosiimonas endolithica]